MSIVGLNGVSPQPKPI